MKFKKIALAIGIVIILSIFFNYGIYTFYKPPKYESFCPQDLFSKTAATESDCTKNGGLWHASGPEVPVITDEKRPTAWCDIAYQCNKDFQVVRDVYNRNVFVILTILGILSLLAGIYIISVDAVTNGFLFGGILSIIIGAIRYWSAMDDYLRFIISGIALILLIWVGYKKLNK